MRAVGQKQNNRVRISTKLQCSVFVWAVRTWLISLPPDDSLGNNIGWRPFTSPQWLIGMQKNFYYSLWQTKKFKSALIFSLFLRSFVVSFKGQQTSFLMVEEGRSQNAGMDDVIFSPHCHFRKFWHKRINQIWNKPFLILPSSLSRYSSAPKTKRIFQMLRCIFEIIQFIHFYPLGAFLSIWTEPGTCFG